MATRPPKGVCHFCGDEIPSYVAAAVPITGWAAERTGGGVNNVLAKQIVPGYVAHAVCVKAKAHDKKAGLIEGQISFLPDE